MTIRQSWIESANDPNTDFPVENLPFGVFSVSENKSSNLGRRIGIAIGDQVFDVSAEPSLRLFQGPALNIAHLCSDKVLNRIMSASPESLGVFRQKLQELFWSSDKSVQDAVRPALLPANSVALHLPADIGDYTDFYASIEHAANVGSMFRPDNPLLPNYKYVPIGYHGRASSIVVSGAGVTRPRGQIKPVDAESPRYEASSLLDYEAEVGFFVGRGNDIGCTIPIAQAEDHIFGFCLLNDWSARDIQAWEYQPLGPFLAKNFATTISPWVVTRAALEPFRRAGPPRPVGDPEPLPYLRNNPDQSPGALDLQVEVYLMSSKMRAAGLRPHRLSSADFSGLYWTAAQMLTHHASGGCNLRSGDLLGSGTVSGKEKDSRGCMLELTWRGAQPITLPNGEQRKFLEDGDEVIMRGLCEREGARRIGFGECRGTILPAIVD